MSVERIREIAEIEAQNDWDSEGPGHFSVRDALFENLNNRIIDCMRELLEYGYAPQEAADYMTSLMDAIAGELSNSQRERKFRESL